MIINIETKTKKSGFVLYNRIKYYFNIEDGYIMFEPGEILDNKINRKTLQKFDFHIRNVIK